jgi:uncharacterized protein YndB with AHSA1/START domain
MAKPTESMRVQVRRRMPAPRDVVYAAWTNPEGLRHWMCPGDVISAEAKLDLRVGGEFRIVMKSKTAEYVHTGTYQVVDPPAKLVFTWTAANHPPTLVTVEFLDHGAESELVLTHERFTDGDVAKRYEGGWATIAEKFAAYLNKQTKK